MTCPLFRPIRFLWILTLRLSSPVLFILPPIFSHVMSTPSLMGSISDTYAAQQAYAAVCMCVCLHLLAVCFVSV